MEPLFLLGAFVVVVFATLTSFASRYRRCPSDKVLVVYGKISGDKGLSARCYHGGPRSSGPSSRTTSSSI